MCRRVADESSVSRFPGPLRGNVESMTRPRSRRPSRLRSRTRGQTRLRMTCLHSRPKPAACRSDRQRLPAWHPVAIFFLGLVLCYVVARSRDDPGRARVHDVDPPAGRVRVRRTRGPWSGWPTTAHSFLDALSLSARRSPADSSFPGSSAVVVIISAFQTRWLLAGFVLAAIVLESATYRDHGLLRRSGTAGRRAARRPAGRTRASPRATSPRRSPCTRASRSCSPRA